jgi:chromosome segregation ATPase
MAGLRQRISELELELARRLSLESEVARLSKLLDERESELANHDALIADAELRRNVAEAASQGLSAHLDERTPELFALKAHTDNVEARYSATSCSNTVLRADLSAAKAQRRIAEDARQETEEAQSTAEEKLKAVEEKLKEVELGLQAAQAELQKPKLKSCELQKKSKHYKSKAAHYKSKADRFHSQILAFTKVRDRTWVNGFSWGFDSLKEFVLNPPTPSPNFAGLN